MVSNSLLAKTITEQILFMNAYSQVFKFSKLFMIFYFQSYCWSDSFGILLTIYGILFQQLLFV